MYKCKNCGVKFDEPIEINESHGLDTPPYEKVYVCPCCYCDNFEELKEDEDDSDN